VREGSADLIAIKSNESIDALSAIVSAAIGIELHPRESSYWGDPYYSGWPDSEVMLTANLDPTFQQGDSPQERWFSSSSRDAPYLLWELPDRHAALVALSHAGLAVELAQRD
jgi:hypothetical protein